MNHLQTVRMSFSHEAPTEQQRPGSNGQQDKNERDHLSTTSDTSGDDLEAGFVKTRIKKSRLCIGPTDYARGCKKSFIDWSSAQPRSVLASIFSVTLGAFVILYIHAPLAFKVSNYRKAQHD